MCLHTWIYIHAHSGRHLSDVSSLVVNSRFFKQQVSISFCGFSANIMMESNASLWISRFSSAVRWKLWRSSGAGHGLHETSGLWNISEMSKTSKKPINCGIITGAETTNSTRYPIMIWPSCIVALACLIMFGIRQNVHKTRRVSESALFESDWKGLFFRRWILQ